MTFRLTPGKVSLSDCRRIWSENVFLELDPSCFKGIDASSDFVAEMLSEGQAVFGANIGVGSPRGVEDNIGLQRNLTLSHCTSVGPPINTETLRLMVMLKINCLSRGYSGVRREIIETLVLLFNHQIYPVIPSQGSSGSGDFSLHSRLGALLMGEGEALVKGEQVTAKEALKSIDLKPTLLINKEALALMTGTQASLAFALEGLFLTENVYASALVASSLSLEAALGSRVPFEARISEVRGHKGQVDTAFAYRHLLETSEISESHKSCSKVQDPYSLRCCPQVLGACLNQIREASDILKVEVNAVTDNPLIIAETKEMLHGGNFHGEPIAFAADKLALALSEIGSISERRLALLIDSKLSQLPPFIVSNHGINSGFMLAHVTASSLVMENKVLAHPYSVDSNPTVANREDHVSNSNGAARRLKDMSKNTANVISIELLAACQGIDFKCPLKTSPRLEEAKSIVRKEVKFLDQDRILSKEIEIVQLNVLNSDFNHLLPKDFLPSSSRDI